MAEHEIQQTVDARGLGLALRDIGARRFQQMPIFDARRTGSFTGATSQTAIDVVFESERVGREPAFFHRSHQVDPPTRAVVFIAGRDISRTCLETEATMNTGEDFLFFA